MHFPVTTNKLTLLTFLLIVMSLGQIVQAATVKLTGKAPEYAQNTIELNRLHDFISEEPIKLGTIRFDQEGFFNLEFELAETSLCFADFDGYHGMIYLEPGKSYEIMLPPKRNLTESQKRNPFVKPELIWFGIANPAKNELNIQIQQFEQAYTNHENNYFDRIFVERSRSLVDTVKNKLDKEFSKTAAPLFEQHKFYRKANLEFALHQGKSADFMKTYFSTEKPVYILESYSTLFNQVFLNYFDVLANMPQSSEVKGMINSASLQKLDDYFQKKLHFNKDLARWVLLKSLKDAYYSKQFSKAAILKMLDQVSDAGWGAYEQKTARLIRSKLTYLASGTNPPTLILKTLNNRNINFSDYKGTYIYLHFTDPKNTVCRQHLDVLKNISARYKEKLVIINVIPHASGFKNENGWAGIFATTTNNIAETYKVKTYPNSFLIGKDGKLLYSPAPNPIDGLDRQLGQIFKSDHFRQLQKNNNPAIK